MTDATFDTPRTPYRETVRTAPAEVVEQTRLTLGYRGMSWGAILAGALVALAIQMALNMLGLSIGANTINPISEANPLEPAIGTAAILWMAGSMMLALFAGGWVAGRTSGAFDNVNGMLHGIAAWSLAALLTMLLLGSTVGSIVSGISGAVGQGVSLLAQGAVQTVPEIADRVSMRDLTMDAINAETRSLFAGNTSGATGTTDATGTESATTSENEAVTAFSSLEDLQLSTRITNFLTAETDDPNMRTELVTLMTERTGMTEQEANEQLDRWQQAYVEIRDDLEARSREVAQTLTDTLTAVAGAIFLSMLLGAFAAGAGGWVGTQDQPAVITRRETATA